SFVAAGGRLVVCCLRATMQSGVFGLVLAPAGWMTQRSPRPAAREELEAVLTDVLAELEGPAEGRVVGVGRASTSLRRAVARLEAAAQVAEVASTLDVRRRSFYRSSDVRLRGLLSLLAEDSRLRAFAEGELGPLLGDTADEELLDLLGLYLAHGGNKSA